MSASKDYILKIDNKQPSNQSKAQALIYRELLTVQLQLTKYLNDTLYDNLKAFSDRKWDVSVTSSPALTKLAEFINSDFSYDGAEDNVVAEEDGQYHEVAPPKDVKKKKKKRSSS